MDAVRMDRLGEHDRPGFGHHLRVYTFRILTVVMAWALVVTAYYQMPELLTGTQRLMQQGIEAFGNASPSPWRYGWIAFREMGGVIWLQITLVILTLRIMLSAIAATWRLIFRNTLPSKYERMSDPVALVVYGALTLAFFVLLFLVLLAL